MDSKQIEIEGMKELLKENELEIGRLRKEIKKLKEERDNFMLKYSKAVEEKVVETNKLCTERNMLEEKNKKLKADYIKLSKIVEITGGYKASYVNELRDKIAKLEKELNAVYKAYHTALGVDYIDEDLYDLDC